MGKQGVKIEIMDTTLRDGEQTSGVSFVPHEKLMIARLLLEDLKVDRVEVASARVSEGEFEAVKMICDWAARRNLLQRFQSSCLHNTLLFPFLLIHNTTPPTKSNDFF